MTHVRHTGWFGQMGRCQVRWREKAWLPGVEHRCYAAMINNREVHCYLMSAIQAKETVLSVDSLSDASSAGFIWRARVCIHL